MADRQVYNLRPNDSAAAVAQLAEHHVANVIVVGSNPISRSFSSGQFLVGPTSYSNQLLVRANLFFIWPISSRANVPAAESDVPQMTVASSVHTADCSHRGPRPFLPPHCLALGGLPFAVPRSVTFPPPAIAISAVLAGVPTPVKVAAMIGRMIGWW